MVLILIWHQGICIKSFKSIALFFLTCDDVNQELRHTTGSRPNSPFVQHTSLLILVSYLCF